MKHSHLGKQKKRSITQVVVILVCGLLLMGMATVATVYYVVGPSPDSTVIQHRDSLGDSRGSLSAYQVAKTEMPFHTQEMASLGQVKRKVHSAAPIPETPSEAVAALLQESLGMRPSQTWLDHTSKPNLVEVIYLVAFSFCLEFVLPYGTAELEIYFGLRPPEQPNLGAKEVFVMEAQDAEEIYYFQPSVSLIGVWVLSAINAFASFLRLLTMFVLMRRQRLLIGIYIAVAFASHYHLLTLHPKVAFRQSSCHL